MLAAPNQAMTEDTDEAKALKASVAANGSAPATPAAPASAKPASGTGSSGVNGSNAIGTDETQIAGGGVFGWGTQGFNKYSANANAWDTSGMDPYSKQISGQESALASRPTQQAGLSTATATGIDATQQSQDRSAANGITSSLTNSLEQEAAGGGPVQQASRAQLQAGTDQTVQSQMALAASQEGGNPMLAYRNAMNNAAGAQQTGANQAAALTASNSLAAQQQLQGVAGLDQSQGAQDLNLASQQAGIQNANSQFNATAANTQADTNLASSVNQQQYTDDATQKYLAMGMSVESAKEAAAQDYQKFQVSSQAQQEAAAHGVAVAGEQAGAAQLDAVGKVGAALASSGGTIAAAASDKRAKKNISDGEDETRKFLEALHPHGFEYKDEKFGEGHHIGVMAQDVERAAPEIVIDDTDGVKKLDMRKALSASLASLGSINKRLDRLESKRG